MNTTLERVWRGYALDTLPNIDKARMVYRELEIEIVRLERELAVADRNDLSPASAIELAASMGHISAPIDPDDEYIPNIHNASVA